MPKLGDLITAKLDFETTCPCGGDVGASSAGLFVTHTLPYCNAFARLEPDEFLRYLRVKKGMTDA